MVNDSTEEKLRDYLKRVTAELSQTRRRLREVEESIREPIAVVGMACRYPGADSPEELWDVVKDGRVTITDFPRDRGWDLEALYDPSRQRPNTCYANQAGFLSDIAGFDAEFFGLSDREALAMDPQQRVMLELAWDAIEHARIDPTSLRDSHTGVFNGVITQRYGPDPDQVDEDLKKHLLSGGTNGFVSGRIAYGLGARGASVTVDSTSSSSMVALHLANRALRAGDCDLALAGGVSILSTPDHFVEYSRTNLLSPTSRARVFDERADGINFAEGAGILVLERLSDAQRNGRRILGVIRGSAVTHNGTSNGLTTTNTPAVERLVTRGLADARLAPGDIDIVECHATGQVLSGPIEVRALQNVYGPEHSEDQPLYVGSIKGSYGHSAAAAGVGGVIKMVLALHHETLPKTIVDEPTSDIDWAAHPVEVITQNKPWPGNGRVRRAAINSFGLNGTNGHLIVEEAPREAEQSHVSDVAPTLATPVTPWPLSAKTPAALRGQALKLLSHIESHTELSLLDIGYSLATTRAQYDSRAVVFAADLVGFTQALRALVDDAPDSRLISGAVAESSLGFVFGGTGGYAGLGRQLYRDSTVFAAAVDDVVAYLQPQLDRPLFDLAFGESAGTVEAGPRSAAANFAIEIGLWRMLESFGLKPEFTVGCFAGTLSAAHASGAMTLADACARLLKTEDRSHDSRTHIYSCFHGEEVSAARLKESGVDTFMGLGSDEIGLEDRCESATFIPVLRPDSCEATSVVAALSHAHVIGVPVDWDRFFAGSRARQVDLPTYAFQRRRYWLGAA